jgi:hypothetical protein
MRIKNQKPLSLDSSRPLTSDTIQDFEVYPRMDKLKEKFGSDEIEFAMKGRERFVTPQNFKDVEPRSRLMDRVNEVVFNHLITQKGNYRVLRSSLA